MNDIERMQQLWKKQEETINQNVKLSLECLKEVKSQKSASRLNSYLYLNIFSLIAGCALAAVGSYFAIQYQASTHLLISGSLIALWSLALCYGAISQIQRITKLNYAGPIYDVQRQLQNIRLSALFYLKLSLMIVPFYWAFALVWGKVFMGVDLIHHLNIVMTTFVLLPIAACIYWALSPQNIDKPWARWLMQGAGSQVRKALEDLDELREFESEVSGKEGVDN
ncbi:hypothetical protein [Marinimicrobium sp. ABcell2]|uniref:hypothetical protein n=1 Tax=Marinimicrobium sp. ABcell2 TaxID=3069751 RepID=UPI0027AF2535|nr:hypothetical protein [Marinimicrobium sp. ABcell2]MDQ2076099.1 hypothetical protein [Marinimicrobium sp. ABcell2]